MKQVFHKIMSFTMAFVVLCSTLSFTVNMHYCGDTLVETAMFHKAKGCGMAMEQPTTKACAITKKNCCNDEQLVVAGQDELQLQVDTFSFQKHAFIASFVFTYDTLFKGVDHKVTSFEEYEPPPVTRKLYQLDETYLI